MVTSNWLHQITYKWLHTNGYKQKTTKGTGGCKSVLVATSMQADTS